MNIPSMTCPTINETIELVIESDLENYDKDLIVDSLERVRRDNIKLRERLNALNGVSIQQKKGVWYLNGNEWSGKLIDIKTK